MIGWNEGYNWTYEQFCKVVVVGFEANGEKRMNLDCEHSSYENMKQIVSWAEERGYHAEISDDRETVSVWK